LNISSACNRLTAKTERSADVSVPYQGVNGVPYHGVDAAFLLALDMIMSKPSMS
jgi:hypothetical protein